MLAVPLALLFATVFPEVEDPWPETIGLEFPFTAAGIGGILASILFADASGARRDEAVGIGGLLGFYLGGLFYTLSLLNQIAWEI